MRDFEFDDTRYPYGDLRIGDSTFIANIPELYFVYPHPVQLAVAKHVALRLNKLHHSGEREVLGSVVTNPSKLWQLVHDEAHACRSRGLIGLGDYLLILTQEP